MTHIRAPALCINSRVLGLLLGWHHVGRTSAGTHSTKEQSGAELATSSPVHYCPSSASCVGQVGRLNMVEHSPCGGRLRLCWRSCSASSSCPASIAEMKAFQDTGGLLVHAVKMALRLDSAECGGDCWTCRSGGSGN